MTKYLTGSVWSASIKQVEVEKESESSVWINGRRSAKMTTYECYFDSFEEAKQHLVGKATQDVNNARKTLSHAEENLRSIQAIQTAA